MNRPKTPQPRLSECFALSTQPFIKSFLCARWLYGYFLVQISQLPCEIGITKYTLKMSTLGFIELLKIALNRMASKGPPHTPDTHLYTLPPAPPPPIPGFLTIFPYWSHVNVSVHARCLENFSIPPLVQPPSVTIPGGMIPSKSGMSRCFERAFSISGK